MPRALIVKLSAIGDVIIALPAARALHERGFELDWICGRQAAPLLRQYGWIHVIEIDEAEVLRGGIFKQLRGIVRLWARLPRERYELCATLYYDARYRVLTLPVRAARRVRLSRADRAVRILPGRSQASEYVRILLGALDSWNPVQAPPLRVDAMTTPLMGRVPERTGTGRVVLVPGGARNALRDDAVRRWPVEKYVELARRLLHRGFVVVLSGGPDDVWTLPYFGELIDVVENHIGSLSLLESVAMLDEAHVVVTHDTGPLHLAGMTRVGIVSLFGPTDPQTVLPQRENVVALWGGEDLACRPCFDSRNFAPCLRNGCIADIPVGTVEAEVCAMADIVARGESRTTRLVSLRVTPTASDCQ